MSGLCAQNENARLVELPFLLPWLCCPLLMGLQTNRHFKNAQKTKMHLLLAAALPLVVFVVTIITARESGYKL